MRAVTAANAAIRGFDFHERSGGAWASSFEASAAISAGLNVPTWRGKYFLELSAFRFGLSPKVEMNDHKMYYNQRDLWPLLVRAGFRPSEIRLRYHKFGLNLFAAAGLPADA